MLNQPILEARQPCPLGNIYFREINGTTREAYFSKYKTLNEILKQIYGNQLPEDIKLIYKGRLLYLDQTVSQNKITQNQTINILKNSSKNQYNYHQTASINFKGQLYRIQFQQDEKVIDFKKKVEKQINVPINKQIIFFKDNFLCDEDHMKQYQVNDGDIVYLGEIQGSRKDNVVDFKKKIIHHKLDKNRRGSDGGIILQNQFLRSDKKQPNKFASSQINAISRSTIDPSQSPSKKLQIELFELEQSQNALYDSEYPEETFSPSSDMFIKNYSGFPSQQQQQLFTLKLKASGQCTNDQKNKLTSNSLLKNIFGNKKIVQQESIFMITGTKYSPEIEPLNFQMCQSMQYQNRVGGLKTKNSLNLNQIQSDKDSFNIQAAFNQILAQGKQQVVFCESYYQKQDPQTGKLNLGQNLSKIINKKPSNNSQQLSKSLQISSPLSIQSSKKSSGVKQTIKQNQIFGAQQCTQQQKQGQNKLV